MLRKLLAFALAFGGFGAPAQSATMGLHEAPPAWVRYAGLVESQLETRLAGESEPAKRLRIYLAHAGQIDAVAVRVWVDANGTVSRLAFAPFPDGQADADLKALLEGIKLSQKPPQGLLLPIRLTLRPVPNIQNAAPAASANLSR